MNLSITVGGYVAAGILFWLFIGAREDVATAIEQCNSSKLAAIVETEQTVRKAIESASKARIAELESMALEGQKAVDSANAARIQAVESVSAQELTITRLQLEASVDEIPDSNECLNVFIPAAAVAGMRNSGTDCRSSGNRQSGNDQICADSRVITETDFPSEDFADITFGNGLTLWEVDRSTIRTQNAQLEAIGTLRDQP